MLATLAELSAAQASDPAALGQSVAAHAAYLAFHLEVAGERGPFDWKGSFGSGQVTGDEWTALQARVAAAYRGLTAWAKSNTDWNEDTAGTLAGALAHVTYHLGAASATAQADLSSGTQDLRVRPGGLNEQRAAERKV